MILKKGFLNFFEFLNPYKTSVVLIVFLFILISPLPSLSQEESNTDTDDYQKIQSMLHIISSQAWLIQKELDDLKSMPASKAITKRKDELLTQLDGLNRNFELLATQLNSQDFILGDEQESNWIKELEALTLPLLEALSDLTKKPRHIEKLKKRVATLEEQLEKFESGWKNINSLIEMGPAGDDPKGPEAENYLKNLNRLRNKFNPDLVRLQLNEAKQSLDNELKDNETIIEAVSRSTKNFFKHRGLNVLITVGIFAFVWFVLMKIRVFIVGSKSFLPFPDWLEKLLVTAYSVLVVIICISLSLVSLYLLNDWLLLSVLILFLAAVVWAGRQFLPKLFKEIRLALNLGTVKESERLIWNGVPWFVESIGLQATLVNSNLEGGKITLPVGELVGKYSRPHVEDEPWFPTNQGDWVFLSDGTYGQIKNQTVEQVVLQLKGGTLKYYTVAEFIAKTPMNISRGFRYDLAFGLDYELQSKICDVVPQLFDEGIRQNLKSHFEGNPPDFTHLEISFDTASASSLNLRIIIHVDGRCADQHEEIEREIQTTLVKICNKNGFRIPFTQLTVNLSDELKRLANTNLSPGTQPPSSV